MRTGKIKGNEEGSKPEYWTNLKRKKNLSFEGQKSNSAGKGGGGIDQKRRRKETACQYTILLYFVWCSLRWRTEADSGTSSPQ